tara:strand:- start:36 stop:458 length:423 start_codon:yes stop_codon:yes gene_type:complete
MNYEAIMKAVVGVGITECICEDGIVDEATYKTKLKVVTGFTGDPNDPEAVLGEPTVPWSTFKAKYDEIYGDHPKSKLREVRDMYLARCDWTQGEDVPATLKNKWKTYRQALRDLPATANPSLNADGSLDETSVNWPTKPS